MAGVKFAKIDQAVMRGFAKKTIPNATKPGSLLALRTRVLQPIISGQVTLSSPALVTMAAGLDLRISARLKELELAPAAAAAPLTEMLEQAPFLPPTPAPEVHSLTGEVAQLVETPVEAPSTENSPGALGIVDRLREEMLVDLERELNAAKLELARLREEAGQLRTANAQIQGEVLLHQSEASRLRIALANAQDGAAALGRELEAARQEIRVVTGQNVAAEESRRSVEEQLAAANTARKAAEAAAAAAATRADEAIELADLAAAAHQEKLAAATGDFRDQLARMEKRAGELRKAIELLTKQWGEKVTENQRNAQEVAARRSALKSTEESRTKRLQEKELAFATVEALIIRLKAAEAKREALAAKAEPNLTIEERGQLAQLEKSLQILGETADPIEVRMLQKKMEAIKTAAGERARQELAGIEAEIARLEEELTEAIQAKTRAIGAVGNVEGVIEHLSDLLRQAEKQLAATNQAALALFEQLNGLHQEKKELEITLAQLKERRRQFDLQQREIRMAVSAAASRVDNLLASIPPAPEEKTS